MSNDRNLLFGMLALHNVLVTREQLRDAMTAWLSRKATPLGVILREQGALSEEDERLLEGLVARQIGRHGDARSGLSSLPINPAAIEEFSKESSGWSVPSMPPEGRPPGPAPRYERRRFHASGGLGEVYVAHDKELSREVALKEIQSRYADDEENRRRFVLEAMVTGHLEHPGIVPVYGLETDPTGRPSYAMRFVQGETLQEAIEKFHSASRPDRGPADRGLAMRDLLTRFVNVCNAVAYAHSRGVVHCDLKPANVLLGDYGETLVVDWGLARRERYDGGKTEPATPVEIGEGAWTAASGGVGGTPAYMPPEQARGERHRIGPLTDVWALGAVLYAVLTGQPPYLGGEVDGVKRQARECAPRRPWEVNAKVPAALDAVCVKAMAPQQQDRFPSARALRAEIEVWLAAEAVSEYLSEIKEERERTREALERAVRAEEEARTNLGQAEANLQRAATNLKLARSAVDLCFNVCWDHPLFMEQRMDEVKKLLLGRALSFYQNFRSQSPNDVQLLREEAEQWNRLLYINLNLKRIEEAFATYERAKAIYDELARIHPDEPSFRSAQEEILALGERLATLTSHQDQGKQSVDQPSRPWAHFRWLQRLVSSGLSVLSGRDADNASPKRR